MIVCQTANCFCSTTYHEKGIFLRFQVRDSKKCCFKGVLFIVASVWSS